MHQQVGRHSAHSLEANGVTENTLCRLIDHDLQFDNFTKIGEEEMLGELWSGKVRVNSEGR